MMHWSNFKVEYSVSTSEALLEDARQQLTSLKNLDQRAISFKSLSSQSPVVAINEAKLEKAMSRPSV